VLSLRSFTPPILQSRLPPHSAPDCRQGLMRTWTVRRLSSEFGVQLHDGTDSGSDKSIYQAVAADGKNNASHNFPPCRMTAGDET